MGGQLASKNERQVDEEVTNSWQQRIRLRSSSVSIQRGDLEHGGARSQPGRGELTKGRTKITTEEVVSLNQSSSNVESKGQSSGGTQYSPIIESIPMASPATNRPPMSIPTLTAAVWIAHPADRGGKILSDEKEKRDRPFQTETHRSQRRALQAEWFSFVRSCWQCNQR